MVAEPAQLPALVSAIDAAIEYANDKYATVVIPARQEAADEAHRKTAKRAQVRAELDRIAAGLAPPGGEEAPADSRVPTRTSRDW